MHKETGLDCQGLRGRRAGKMCLMCIEFGRARKFCRWMMAMVHNNAMNCTLKDDYTGKFCYMYFNTIKKKKCEGHC